MGVGRKAKLEQQESLHSTVKQRREQQVKDRLVTQVAAERSKRQQLQLCWASLEQTMQVCVESCLRPCQGVTSLN
jgi:hypothetical protein